MIKDDAVVPPDVYERLNHHLARLPDDWNIFVAGYIWIWHTEAFEHVNEDVIATTCYAGHQCLAVRPGERQ